MSSKDLPLFKKLLNKSFYTQNKSRLNSGLFDGDLEDLFFIVRDAHNKYDTLETLTAQELKHLWRQQNPVATVATISVVDEMIDRIEAAPDANDQVAADIIQSLWLRNRGTKLANASIKLAEGNLAGLSELKSIMHGIGEAYEPDDFGTTTTKDIEELTTLLDDKNRLAFNIMSLRKQVYGLAKREFCTVFATPETGKTAFVTSIAFGPGGFIQQGYKGLILVNEEDSRRTMMRAISSATGLSKQQIADNPRHAAKLFQPFYDAFEMKDIQGWDTAKVEEFVEKHNPDFVVLDQGDKVQVNGHFTENHFKLRALYIEFREIAKRRDVALINVSQASADAAGKTVLTLHEMEGSKIGKAAECDLILGIGKMPETGDEEPNVNRYVTCCKNKISGSHAMVVCKIQPEISRYVD